ncbi:MAG TPA: dTDP-glucose 4,6-dehydratase [Allosphingosinicella sp.]|jgi:dTDP-glucose 4,6-dehydratase
MPAICAAASGRWQLAEARRTVLVTGGAGFIGSAVCRHLASSGRWCVVNVDALTYCGSLAALDEIAEEDAYSFHRADIRDEEAMLAIMRRERIDAVMHLAAETHVDRSIARSAPFVETNVLGTARLLDACLRYRDSLPVELQAPFRFHHVSTDEVFGDAGADGAAFSETTPYAPSSPYAASKAASDHLVRAWHRTYGLPVVLSNSTNSYGPWQYPEKLIPLMIGHAIEERPMPVYGDGGNVRDWLFVEDHARALERVLADGAVGETYIVGARSERSNVEVVERICDLIDARRPLGSGASRRSLIAFVEDRPGHDRRYSADPSKIERELGWRSEVGFEQGLARTVDWYLANEGWWRPLLQTQ